MARSLPQTISLSEANACRNGYIGLTLAIVIGVAMSFFTDAKGQTADGEVIKPEVAAILEQLRLSLIRVKSIQYKYEHVMHRNVDRGPKYIHQNIEYAYEGNLFFNSINEKNEDGDNHAEFAYNGKQHQRLYKDKTLYTKKSPDRTGKESGPFQPIVVPFFFALDKSPPNFNILLNRSTWDEVARRASIKGKEEHDGRSCSILTLNQVSYGSRDKITVYLDEGLDYYPVKIIRESPEDKTHVETIITTSKFATSYGDVVIPMKISTKATRTSGNQREIIQTVDYIIDPASLKVNQPVDHAIFTIDESEAAGGIYDDDNRVWIKPPPAESANVSSQGTHHFLFVFSILCCLLLIAATVYWLLVAKKKRTT